MELFETPYQLNEKNKHIQKVAGIGKTNIVNIQLQRGETVPEHDADADVVIIVRSGKVSFIVEGKTVEATAQNILHMNPLEKHSLEAVEDADLIVMQIKQ